MLDRDTNMTLDQLNALLAHPERIVSLPPFTRVGQGGPAGVLVG